MSPASRREGRPNVSWKGAAAFSWSSARARVATPCISPAWDLRIYALEYSESGLWGIIDKGVKTGLGESISPVFHDLRKPLPFEENSIDGCFSHMLYCMAFSRAELEFLNGEIRRVLKPGGLNIYTVRHKGDAHYGQGTHLGEDLYEMNGFVVHYFDRAMVEHLAGGFDLLDIEEFEEGSLPRKLFQVTLRKK